MKFAAQEMASLTGLAVSALHEDRVSLTLHPIVSAQRSEIAFHQVEYHMSYGANVVPFSPSQVNIKLQHYGIDCLFDRRVLELATEQLYSEPSLRLSINVSCRSLSDPDWLETYLGCTETSQGNLAKRLIIQIPETALTEDLPSLNRVLYTLQRKGSKIAVGNFKGGRNTRARLNKFPIDMVRLDARLTRKTDNDNYFIVRALIDVAHQFNFETVVEWEGDMQQAALFADWGITYLQKNLNEFTLSPGWVKGLRY